MKENADTMFLRQKFLSDVKVFDAEHGYLSVPSFMLRMDPEVLRAAAKLIAHYFSDQQIDAVHGIPHSGVYLATAVSLALPNKTHLHSSRKDQLIPSTWKEIYRKEVRSFSSSVGGLDVFGSINLSFVRKGDKVLLIDDVCAKGETGYTIAKGLLEKGVKVVGFAVLFDKVFQGGLERIEKLGVKTFSCLRVLSIEKGDKVRIE